MRKSRVMHRKQEAVKEIVDQHANKDLHTWTHDRKENTSMNARMDIANASDNNTSTLIQEEEEECNIKNDLERVENDSTHVLASARERLKSLLLVTDKAKSIDDRDILPRNQYQKEILRRTKLRIDTEEYLNQRLTDNQIDFKYFITLEFLERRYKVSDQVRDNRRIKRQILKYFYPMHPRIWMVNERHKDGGIHVHVLVESTHGNTSDDSKYIIDTDGKMRVVWADESKEGSAEELRRYLSQNVKRVCTSKRGVDVSPVGDISRRIHYLNKSIERGDFTNVDHIDFENSDI